ncbi:hypothetical protein FWK35_00026567 [Aphis craccivora]|uniref:Uncharacterized protein n=1 Tax=Aphis craccivora TaxID=307492 RepID=A0A6G0ZMC2_APHCR|nr:hypothetical protein FWK35_00026567 [Aphis craccivora]
MNVVGTLGGQK